MTNIFELLHELKNDPVKFVLQYLEGLGEPFLQLEIDRFLTNHVSDQRRAELSGPLADLSKALQAKDNTAAAKILTGLILSTRL